MCEKYKNSLERGGSALGFGVVEVVCVVFVTILGVQVEVCADLHLLGKKFNYIPPGNLQSCE